MTPGANGTFETLKHNNEMKNYCSKTIAAFLGVPFTMPLRHALMIIMERTLEPSPCHIAAFIIGFVGIALAAAGVFVKGDTRQTLC